MREDFIINETPGICGGYPRIGHTRIAVRSLVEVYLDTNKDIEQTAEMFPQLSKRQVKHAIAWWRENPERVNEDIARNERAWAEITSQR
jgi:uncharacterized protein (DUF433 family)